MKIATYHQSNPEVAVLEIHGELTGSGALRLADFLYSSLDEGVRYKIINLAHVKKANGLWLNVLEDFINRGVMIRLFNVGLVIQNILRLSGKGGVIKTYNCRDHDEALKLLDEEIMEEKESVRDKVMGRRFNRVNVFSQTEIKCNAAHDEEIMYKAVVRNISEGGVFTDLITSFNAKSGERLNKPEIAGKDLSNINFCLSEDSELIVADGECVWEAIESGKHYAGINFKNMKQIHRAMIRDYVHKQGYN